MNLFAVDNADQYPSSLPELGVVGDEKTTYQYVSDDTVSPRTFCLTATRDGVSYYASGQSGVAEGICRDNSIIIWNKLVSSSSPLPAIPTSSSVYRVSPPSLQLGPSYGVATIRGGSVTIAQGQVYRASLWIKTDPDWNGSSNNSKIRFGDQSDNLIHVCNYNGVKIDWTYVSCTYAVQSGVTSLRVRVGNDGNTGTIWIDDFVLAKLS